MIESKLKFPSRAVAPLLTAAILFTLAACKTPQLQSAPPTTPIAAAPMPAPPAVNVKLTPTYEAIAKRDFGTQNEQLESIIKQISAAKPDQYAEIELQLLGVLQSPTSTTPAKSFALDMLRVTGSKICIPTAASLLADKDLSHNARRVLASLNTPEANAALRIALAHTDGELQIGIINTLGDLRDAAAIDALEKFLRPPTPSNAAATALGKIGNEKAAKTLEDHQPAYFTPHYVDSLGDINHEIWAAAYLNCAANLGDTPRARDIYKKMYDFKQTGPLARQLSPSLRAAAFTGLVKIEKDAAIPLILENLNSTDPVLRRAAGSAAISTPGNTATLAIARELAAAKTKEDKLKFLTILSARNDAKGITPQINELAGEKTTEQDLRIAAITALSTLGDATSVAVLSAAQKTPGPVADAAAKAFAELDNPAITDALLKQMTSTDNAIRAAAINALAEKHNAAVLPIARAVAAESDADQTVRITAIKALGTLGATDDFKSLLAELKKENNDQSANAITDALSAIVKRNDKDKNALADLVIESANTGDVANRQRLLAVLATIASDKSRKAISESLAAKFEPEHRKTAVRLLNNWQGTSAMNDLLKTAKEDPDDGVKILAIQGYIRMASSNGNPGEKVNRLKIAAEAAARPDEKRRAIAALGNIPTTEALKAVEPMLTEKDLANEAYNAYEKIAETLTKSNAVLAKTALTKVSTDAPSPQLRDKAKRAAEGIK